uniref:Acyl-CoA thioesterase 8 n=1 Tax=Ursus maritimus TaxID=29073 RepID=A0A384CP75_URSMA
MSSRQAPEDEQGGGDPPGDLRSVLVTSVLSLEPLDEDLFRGPQGAGAVPGGADADRDELLGALGEGRAARQANLHLPGLLPAGSAQPRAAPVLHAQRAPAGRAAGPQGPHRPVLKLMKLGKWWGRGKSSGSRHRTDTWILARDPNLQKKYLVGLNRIAAKEVPIEIKPVKPPILSQLESLEPKQMFWVRARGHIGEGDMKMHCCVAAYISDYAFLGTAVLPHHWQHQVRHMVSLDHSMWFHTPFRADHWMLYECESPWAGGSRGLVQGRLWRRDGVLAVSCAQEGMIRVKPRVSESKL